MAFFDDTLNRPRKAPVGNALQLQAPSNQVQVIDPSKPSGKPPSDFQAIPIKTSGASEASAGGVAPPNFLDKGLESALDQALTGLLTNGGIVGTGFEDAANLLREQEKASTLANINRNAEMFNSAGVLNSGQRLEAQTEIQDIGQQNLFAALTQLELERLGLMQQGLLGGVQGTLGLNRLGIDEFLALLQASQAFLPGGGGQSSGDNSSSDNGFQVTNGPRNTPSGPSLDNRPGLSRLAPQYDLGQVNLFDVLDPLAQLLNQGPSFTL